eukprot:jgi/Chrpa1/27518/Chrysochromulina_OHIO_Genome00026392-RA
MRRTTHPRALSRAWSHSRARVSSHSRALPRAGRGKGQSAPP